MKAGADALLCVCTHAVRTAPLALRGFVKLGLKADKVVSSRTGVTQDDLSTLLTHLAVVLMVSLIAVPFLFAWNWRVPDNTGRKTELSENVFFCFSF